MSMQALGRRLARLQQGVGGIATQMAMLSAFSPRQFAEDEQDRNRTFLAAEILKVRVEVAPADADLAELARQALSAAEVIYPELPPDEEN